jgi:ATP-binding cassette, subfamily B, bacterial CvaB/MchF/RaxB
MDSRSTVPGDESVTSDTERLFGFLPQLRRRPPVILQGETTECGLACLASIASYHGQNVSLGVLRARFFLPMGGVTLAQMMSMSSKLGLASRPLRADLHALAKLRTPCVLHWNLDHFVVLEKATSRKIWIVDPSIGRRTLSIDEASKSFTGVALELTPTNRFEPSDRSSRLTLLSLLKSASGLPRALLQIFLLSLVIQLVTLIVPIYSQMVIDEVIGTAGMDLLNTLGLAFALFTILTATIGAIRSFAIRFLGANMKFGWAARLFHHLISLPLSYFERRSVADVLSRFKSLGAIQNLVSNAIVETVMDGMMATTTVVVMFFYSPTLALISVVALGLYTIVRTSLYRANLERSNEAIICAAREDGYFLESIRGILAIKAFAKESIRESTWQTKTVDTIRASMSVGALTTAQQFANQLLFGLESVIILWVGARLAIEGDLTIGMLVAFLAYKTQFTMRSSALVDKIIEFRLLRVHLDRLSDIAFTDPEDFPAVAREGVTREEAATLELVDVSFRYSETDPWIIYKANLKIEAGSCIALSAPSGRGKTTLIKVMMGLLSPTEGRVLLNGIDIARAPARGRVAAVMQEDTLLTGTLAENIAFFDHVLDFDRIQACARAASIHDDIERMPMKYSMLVGDMGAALSGGQKQRVLLARALYAAPSVLFLDEATSHLDQASEAQVQSSISALKITRVLIAHRAETLVFADKIITLDEIDSRAAESVQPSSGKAHAVKAGIAGKP